MTAIFQALVRAVVLLPLSLLLVIALAIGLRQGFDVGLPDGLAIIPPLLAVLGCAWDILRATHKPAAKAEGKGIVHWIFTGE